MNTETKNKDDNVEEPSLVVDENLRASNENTTTKKNNDGEVEFVEEISQIYDENPRRSNENTTEKTKAAEVEVVKEIYENCDENPRPADENTTKKSRRIVTPQYKLKLVSEAKVTSNRAVGRKYHFDESLIRNWRKKEDQLKELLSKKSQPLVRKGRFDQKRVRLGNPGPKPQYLELEEQILQWIGAKRSNGLIVTIEQIKQRALELSTNPDFKASSGWADSFMRRFNLKMRQKTHQSQRLPSDLFPKIISFFKFLRKTLRENPEIEPSEIYAMDETGNSFAIVSQSRLFP